MCHRIALSDNLPNELSFDSVFGLQLGNQCVSAFKRGRRQFSVGGSKGERNLTICQIRSQEFAADGQT
jgi:hypothetical protein